MPIQDWMVPPHLRNVREFWKRRVLMSDPTVDYNISGDKCYCCNVAMYPGLLHFVYRGANSLAYHICSECNAKHAEYVEWLGTICHDCGCELDPDVDHPNNTDGNRVCEDCANSYFVCDDCGKVVNKDESHDTASGDCVCEFCYEDHYLICEHCGEVANNDRATWIERLEINVCNDCLGAHYFCCNGCGDYIRNGNGINLDNGGAICYRCYGNGDYAACDDCGGVNPFDCMNRTENGYYCEECYSNHDDNRIIHEYNYSPDWIKHQTARDRAANPTIRNRFFLGVELEVENKAGRRGNESVAADVINTVPAICKDDSSIHDGFEIVFHPQTYDYATTEGKEAIDSMLDLLRNNGFAGHNYGGMHVHISYGAFTQLHAYKFHRLFYQCAELFTVISQRKVDNLNSWGSFSNMGNRPGQQLNRYSALNYTGETVEVRIFNSTIRTDRFFKNLEAVKAALDFSKQYGILDMEPAKFLRFIMDNRHAYKNLVTFLVEHSEGSLKAANVDAKAIKQVQKRLSRMAA